MATEIFSNRKNYSWAWIEVSKGRKFITLSYKTCIEGDRNITLTYPLASEAQLIECLTGFPTYGIDDLVGNIIGTPHYIRIRRSDPIR